MIIRESELELVEYVVIVVQLYITTNDYYVRYYRVSLSRRKAELVASSLAAGCGSGCARFTINKQSAPGAININSILSFDKSYQFGYVRVNFRLQTCIISL